MNEDGHTRELQATAERLSRVSPSFCLAKWLQVTLHLHNGHTHSCHHPNTHKVPLEELKASPSALHNTSLKKALRRQMLEGQRPSECGYCWTVEDLPGKHFSDRILKSNDEWALPKFDRVLQASSTEDINPTYVEVSFSHACNFRCAYCDPSVSSKWEAEIKKFGDYPTTSTHHSLEWRTQKQKQSYPVDGYNPYVEAFWKWWPDLYKDLKTFRITGGEPLLVNDTYKVLDWFVENPRPDLELAINSNLCAPDKKIETFIEKSKPLLEKKRIRSLVLYTSLDTWGKDAEYIRNGLDLDAFQRNVEKILSIHEEVFLTVMCTYSMLSVPNFKGLLDYIADLKERYPQSAVGHWPRITLDISYLRYPEFFTLPLLPRHLHEIMEHDLAAMSSMKMKNSTPAFSSYEINKFKRVISYAKTAVKPEDLLLWKKDFGIFFSEHDRRRSTDFRSVFPMFRDFFEECVSLSADTMYDRFDRATSEVQRSSASLIEAQHHLESARRMLDEASRWNTSAVHELKESESKLDKLKRTFGDVRSEKIIRSPASEPHPDSN